MDTAVFSPPNKGQKHQWLLPPSQPMDQLAVSLEKIGWSPGKFLCQTSAHSSNSENKHALAASSSLRRSGKGMLQIVFCITWIWKGGIRSHGHTSSHCGQDVSSIP